jgi:hypothetical protein
MRPRDEKRFSRQVVRQQIADLVAPHIVPEKVRMAEDFPDLTYRLVSSPPPSQGTLVLNPDGAYSFTPAADFSGTVTIAYEVDDDTADPDGSAKTIEVPPGHIGAIHGSVALDGARERPLAFQLADQILDIGEWAHEAGIAPERLPKEDLRKRYDALERSLVRTVRHLRSVAGTPNDLLGHDYDPVAVLDDMEDLSRRVAAASKLINGLPAKDRSQSGDASVVQELVERLIDVLDAFGIEARSGEIRKDNRGTEAVELLHLLGEKVLKLHFSRFTWRDHLQRVLAEREKAKSQAP